MLSTAEKLQNRPSPRWSVASDGRLRCTWYQVPTRELAPAYGPFSAT
jgi:hypothetical protein